MRAVPEPRRGRAVSLSPMAERPETVDALLDRMDSLLAPLEERKDPLRLFLATYRRTTLTVRDMMARQEFTDSEWVEHWDI